LRSSSAAALTVFAGRCADRGGRGAAGARALGAALERRTGLRAVRIGRPAPPLGGAWDVELAAARPELERLATRLAMLFDAGRTPITLLPRCAAAIATLPVVARRRPDAVAVWFDAHGDCNTPEQSATGYLGGMVLSGAAGLWPTGLGAGLDLGRVVLAGARDLDGAERCLVEAGAPTLVAPGRDFCARLSRAVAGRPAYVHLDCDVLDPGLVPTEYGVPDGLDFTQLRDACASLAAGDVVGLEIAEFEASPGGGLPEEAEPLLAAVSPLVAASARLSKEGYGPS
jgi:arginase